VYQYQAVLPPFSNREDYLLTIGVNDDDTLEPIDLSGITLANTGASFTSNAWTVTDGGIVTPSTTQITIPMFPVTGGVAGNNLTALSLTVAKNLAINPGDPISIADTATKQNILNGFVTSYTASNGALVVQIGWTFQFEIRRGGPRNQGSGFSVWWDWGVEDDLQPLLQANWANGFLSLISNNIVQILIPESMVRTIGTTSVFAGGQGDAPGTYKVGFTGTDSINTRQFLTASVAFYQGGVTN
jgi:hypothetical protein